MDPCRHAQQVCGTAGDLTSHQQLAEVDQNLSASCIQAAWLQVQNGPAGSNTSLLGGGPVGPALQATDKHADNHTGRLHHIEAAPWALLPSHQPLQDGSNAAAA